MAYMNNIKTLTGRAARRYQDKRDREEAKQRDAQERLAWWRSLTPEEKARHKVTQEAVERIERNGITLQDMELQYDLGLKDGYKQGCSNTFETFFAAIAMALNELHGFDADQCVEVMNEVHDKVVFALSSKDAINDAYKQLGIRIVFNEDDGQTVEGAEVIDD